MAEEEPLLKQNANLTEEVKQNMYQMRVRAQSRKVNAYVDFLAKEREVIDEKLDECIALLAIFSFLSIFASILILEISWAKGKYRHDTFWIELFKFSVTVFTVIQLVFLWWKYELLAQNVAPDKASAIGIRKGSCSYGKWIPHSVTARITWIKFQSPLTFTVEFFFTLIHCTIGVYPIYASLTLFRAYHFLGLMRFLPFIRKLRFQQIESGHVASQSYWSVLKKFLRSHPWISVVAFIAIFLPFLSYAVYAVERHDEESDIQDYTTALWLTTWMLFVGEAYKPSIAGRIPALMCGMSSVVVSTLMFVGLQRTLEYDAQDEAIVTGVLESQLEQRTRKAAAQYVWHFWRSYKKNESDIEGPQKDELQKKKNEWKRAKRDLKCAQAKRPAGSSSVVVHIGNIVNQMFQNLDTFRMSTLAKLHEMHQQCGRIEHGKLKEEEKQEQEILRLVQMYQNQQNQSAQDMKLVKDQLEKFGLQTKDHIKKTLSGYSSFQKEALANLNQATQSMENQFEEMTKKQDTQSKVFEEAKRAAEASKTNQEEQLEMVKRLEEQIKEFKEMQRTLLKSKIQEHSDQVMEKISEARPSGIFSGKRSRSSSRNRRRSSSTRTNSTTTTTTSKSGS